MAVLTVRTCRVAHNLRQPAVQAGDFYVCTVRYDVDGEYFEI